VLAERPGIGPEALDNFFDVTHANHLRAQLRRTRGAATVPSQMFAHTDEASDHAMFFKMTAMLN
jgi:hypothetical protein